MLRYDASQPLIALHIPKTGGTSLRHVLEQWFDPSHLQLYYPADPLFAHAPAAGGPGSCIYGHFNALRGAAARALYPEARQYMAFFREPYLRFVSQWYHLNAQKQSGALIPALDDAPSFERWLQQRAEDQRRGRNAYSFIWHLPWQPGQDKIAAVLDEHFVFLGLTERMDESVAGLAVVLGRQAVAPPHLNAVARAGTEFPQWRRLFEQNFADEMAVYEQVRKRHLAWAQELKGAIH